MREVKLEDGYLKNVINIFKILVHLETVYYKNLPSDSFAIKCLLLKIFFFILNKKKFEGDVQIEWH